MSFTEILKKLGLPLALTAVFSALLLLFDVSLIAVERVFASMIGFALLVSAFVDFGKYAGFVLSSTSGKWSAALNLLGLAIVATLSGLYPTFDFISLDADLLSAANFAFVLLGLVTQVYSSKSIHDVTKNALGIAPKAISAAPVKTLVVTADSVAKENAK